MAINENLTHKVRQSLLYIARVTEKKMFSGIAFFG